MQVPKSPKPGRSFNDNFNRSKNCEGKVGRPTFQIITFVQNFHAAVYRKFNAFKTSNLIDTVNRRVLKILFFF